MKNFTKQNFKTNPLWIRLLIMTFMLLAGAGNTWAVDYWVVGPAVGGWNQWKLMNPESTTRYTFTVNTGEFKITKANNWDNANRLDNIGCNDNNDTYKGNVTCNGANNHSANVAGTLCFNPNDSYMWIESSGTPSTGLTRIVAGTPASVFGTEWDPGNEENKMTKTGDGIYTIDYYTNFQSNTTIKFKVTDGSWSNAWPSDDKSHTISEGCQKTTVTYKTNGNTVDVSTEPSNHCCSAPTSVSITRSDAPSTANICQGSTIDLTANVPDGSGDITYSWTKVSGTNWSVSANSDKQTCTVTAGTGSATFKITATRCGTDITNTINLTADAKPAITLASPSSICTGTEIDLTEDYVTSKTGTVTWYSDANRSQEITNGIVTPINTGTSQTTNTYYAKVTNGVCSAKTDVSLSIKVDPQSAITLKAAPTICQGTTITFANYVDTNIGTVTWHTISDFSDAAITTATPNQTTTYYAKATSGNCAPATASLKVTVDAKPTLTLNSNPTICQGDQITLSEYVSPGSGTVKWYSDLNRTTEITNLTIAPVSTTTYYARATNGVCSAVDKELTVTVVSAPQTPSLSTNINMLNNTNKTATLTIGNYVEGVTYTLYKDNNSTGKTTTSTTFSVTAGGVYKVKGTNSNNPSGCQDTDFSEEITINVCPTPAKPQLTSTAVTTCNSNVTTFGSITITNMAADYDDTYTFTLGGKPTTPNANGKIVISSAANTKYTVTVTNSCGNSNSADVEIAINNITPTISGKTIAQPGEQNAIELTVPTGITAEWSVSPEADLSVSKGNSTMFSAEKNGTYTITATNGTCSDTHVVTVADAFYVYMRQPKESETAYNNFYYPTQNPTQGGDLFYKEYSSIPPAEGYTDYNKGGRAHDVILTDCDGYVWYGFKASAQLIDGTNYFTVHAPNKNGYDGWFTHTDITKPGKMTGDIYYIMGTEGNGSSGWKIEEASAPYSGPVIYATDNSFNSNNFADFAALYVTDCSGKEIAGYQWYKGNDEYVSKCDYITKDGTVQGDAGKTNNIRPTEAGNYSCKVTYKDGSSKTSEAFPVEATSGTTYEDFKSNLPVIMVNTGSKGFPDCTGISGQTASRNASKFKAKRSVDVKIYEGETLVYDRKARMNYRGSSSLNFVKKSYAFCPGDANCGDKDKGEDYVKTAKLNMLGVGKACDKDWVLYAAAADPSLMRNRLVFDSYNAMTGKWGVNSRYVELIINGEYKGVYVFMDKITMNENRVEVNEDKGFIVKFDKTDREDRVGGLNGVLGDEKTFKTSYTGKDDIGTYDTSIDQRFEIEYPEKDDYTTGWKARVDGIQGMFQAFEDALKQGDYATVQKYIDYTSWADWFIINEFTKNVDAYRASCIFVYTGEAGAKIEARPLWDQELSFNNQASKGTSDKGSNSTTGLLIQHSNVYSDAFKAPFWFTGGGSDITGGLLSDPCFVQVVKERWNIHQFGALSKKSLEDLVDKYEDDLAPEGTTENAQTRETTFWDGKSRGKCDCSYETDNPTATGYQNKTFEESKGTITDWISDDAASGAKGRRAGLTTAINGLTGASFSIQIIPSEAKTTPWEPVEIAVSVTPAGYDYKLEYTDNDLGSVANTIIKEEGDKITYRIPRPSDWGAGDAEEGKRTDIEYGIKATLSVQEGTTVCGSQAAPSSTAKIILQDEDNDNCK